MKRHLTITAVAVAALGLLLAACSDDSGDGGSAAEAADSSAPTEAAAPTGPPHLVGAQTPLDPGTYRLSFLTTSGTQPPDATLELPRGYVDGDEWYVLSEDGDQFLGLSTVKRLGRDACHPRRSELVDPGPSVQALADALAAQRATDASPPRRVTLAGHDGVYLELTGPRDITGCHPDPELWVGRGIYGNRQVDLVWILDVDGQRVVVDAGYDGSSTGPAEVEELRSMVDSLTFLT